MRHLSEYRPTGWLILLLVIVLSSACNEPASSSKKSRKAPPHLVEVINVQPRELQLDYERTGTLKYRRLNHIYNQIEGQITSFPWFEGDHVRQGALLVKFDDRLLKAEQAKTNANVRQALQDLQRIQKLERKQVASEDEVMRAGTTLDIARAEEQILATRIGYTEILAPFDGIIVERLAEPGDVKPRHSHLLTLADPASLITQTSVSELLLPQLSINDPVQVRIDALGKTNHTGKILRIHPQLDPENRQGLVEIQFNPAPADAQSGQFARIKFSTKKATRLMVPFTALHRDRKGEYVYIIRDEKARYTRVRSGIKIKQEIEIMEGLKAGDKIITRGFMGLSDSKRVKIVSQGNVRKIKET